MTNCNARCTLLKNYKGIILLIMFKSINIFKSNLLFTVKEMGSD